MSTVLDTTSTYTILINDDNTMTTTLKHRVMQRSKLVDDLWFLVAQFYNGYDMSKFTVVLEYVLPISRQYKSEILSMSSELYNGYLKYTLPFDTELTKEHGDIELMISFIAVELDDNGRSVQRVRKVSGTNITILPITAWSDIIPDDALSALDQRIIMTDAQIRALNELADTFDAEKADDIIYNESNNELQLLSNGKEIGRKVILNTSYESLKDGIPVVDFAAASGNPGTDDETDNVVEF